MNIVVPAPRKAEKKKVKLKMGIQGPSGSGKTWGALALATNLWPGSRICLIDTENGSSELYADRFEFDFLPLEPPFHTDKYIAYIDHAVRLGYDVLIIDSISHQWDGEGGILRRKEELDQRPGSNSYTNWSKFTPEHTRFKEKIVQAPIHIIATLRAKQDYILETNEKGKQTPRKVGMAPIQREGFDYEFSLTFNIQMDHRAEVDKNRTALFDGEVLNIADPSVAERLRSWLESGAEVKPDPLKQIISQEQLNEFWNACKVGGKTKEQIKELFAAHEIQAVNKVPQIPVGKFDELLAWARKQEQARETVAFISDAQQIQFVAAAKSSGKTREEIISKFNSLGIPFIEDAPLDRIILDGAHSMTVNKFDSVMEWAQKKEEVTA
jgi:hypothetical protein